MRVIEQSWGEVGTRRTSPGSTAEQMVIDGAYELYGHRVLRLCLSYLGNRSDAEDAVQETFAGAGPRLATISGDAGAYLCATARKVCHDIQHSRWSQVRPLDTDRPDHRNPEDQTLHRVHLSQLWKRLTPSERTLFSYIAAGYRYEDIARLTGLSAKCVSVRLTRARQRVREMGVAAVAGLLAPWRRLGRARHTMLTNASNVAPLSLAAQAGVLLAAAVAGLTLDPAAQPVVSQTVLARTVAASVGYPDRVAGPGTRVARAADSTTPTTPGALASTPPDLTASPANAVPPLRVTPATDPEHSTIVSFTPSPSFGHDHTVFAAGFATSGCPATDCPALFRSTDGGSTWTNLPASKYVGGNVLLPPTYPADRTVFTASIPTGLQRSNDDGATFQSVDIAPGPATVVPTSVPGDTEILVAPSAAQGTTLIYHDRSGALTPGPALPATVDPEQVAYAGSNLLELGQPLSAVLGPTGSEIVRCPTAGSCSTTDLPGDGSVFHMLVSPWEATDHAVAVYSEKHTFLSVDDGATFTAAPALAGVITVEAFAAPIAGQPALLGIATGTTSPSVGPANVDRLDTLSGTWLALSSFPAGTSVPSLSAPGNNELLASLSPSAPTGMRGTRCSTDGGRTWHTRC